MTLRFLLAMALTALPLAASASTPIDESRPLDARGRVEISNLKGSIQVRTWDKPQVHVGGSLGRGVERLEVDGGGGSLRIEVRYPRNSSDRNSEPTHLVVDVPVLASLEIESVAADVQVTGTAGRTLDVDSVSGTVTVAGAPGAADIESVSGDLRLTLNSASVDVQSVSGSVALRGRLDGEVQAETVSGNIEVDSRGERLRRVSSNSVSGNARLQVGLADGGRISAESVSGDIIVVAPRSLSANVAGETFSGHLRAPGADIQKPRFGPGASFERSYGSGSGEIRMETFSGDAELTLR